MYYCPKCDRTLPKEEIDERDEKLRKEFGISMLSSLRCPVCDTEFIDLDKCKEGGAEHVGRTRRKGSSD